MNIKTQLIKCSICDAEISVKAEGCPLCGHPSEQVSRTWLGKGKAFITTLLAVIGLSGLADGFVEWRAFFEIGFMEHYRAFKVYALSWVSFDVPWWMPDYLILGCVYASSFTQVIAPKSIGSDSLVFDFITVVLGYFLTLLAWPAMIISHSIFIAKEIHNKEKGEKISTMVTVLEYNKIWSTVFKSVFWFVILIFLSVDFYKTAF